MTRYREKPSCYIKVRRTFGLYKTGGHCDARRAGSAKIRTAKKSSQMARTMVIDHVFFVIRAVGLVVDRSGLSGCARLK